MNRTKTWDNIAEKWAEYRQTPSPTVEWFLKNKKGKILDLGCGSGRNFIKTNGKISGTDVSQKMLEFAKQTIEKRKLNIELKLMKKKIPYPNDYFDYAICTAVFHCLNKKQQAHLVKELFRVLKPKAKALISVWSRNSPRMKNKPKECYVPWTIKDQKQQRYTYLFETKELENLLKDVGFKVLKSWEERNLNFVLGK